MKGFSFQLDRSHVKIKFSYIDWLFRLYCNITEYFIKKSQKDKGEKKLTILSMLPVNIGIKIVYLQKKKEIEMQFRYFAASLKLF